VSKREFKPFLGYVGNSGDIRIIINTIYNGGCVAVANGYHRDDNATHEDLERFLNSDDRYFTSIWSSWKPLPKKKKVTMEWWECARLVNELRAEMDLIKEEVAVKNNENFTPPMTNIGFHANMDVEDWEYSTINLLTGEIDQNWRKFEKEVEAEE